MAGVSFNIIFDIFDQNDQNTFWIANLWTKVKKDHQLHQEEGRKKDQKHDGTEEEQRTP